MAYTRSQYKDEAIHLGSQSSFDPIPKIIDSLGSGKLGPTADGKSWYVDSTLSGGGATGLDWDNAAATVDAAINLCGSDGGANRGDWIRVAPGHAETIAAANGWDADVAGITIYHYGNGSNQGTYTFSATGSTIAIGAANVTVIGGRYLAGVSAVVDGIIVEAAGTYFTLMNAEFPEPTTSTFEFVDAIQLTTAGNDVSILNCYYDNNDAIGATAFINGGVGVVERLSVVGCRISGEFSGGAIFSDQIDLECYFAYNTISNITSGQHCIEMTAAATGVIHHNNFFSDAEATTLDPGSMKCIENYVTTAIDASGVLIPVPDVQVGSMKADTTAILVDTGTTLPATLAIDAAAAAPNASHPNYFTVVADMTSATWNTVAAHEIAAVTGMVRMSIIVETTATVVTVGTNGTMALGFAGNTSSIFSATALDAAVTGDIWTAVYGSAATTVVGGAESQSSLTSAIFDVTIVNGTDVGYTIATNAGTTGDLTFHIYWVPLDATGAVTAGAGGVL